MGSSSPAVSKASSPPANTAANIVDWHPDAPARPPDWRRRLASLIRAGFSPPGCLRLDPWVERAGRCEFEPSAAGVGTPTSDADGRDLAVEGAHRVRHALDPRTRRELEARVLVGQPGEAIADRCGLPPQVVEAYEQLFFDVRDRLGAPDYIAAVVVGTSPVDGLPARDLDAIVRGMAYRGGPHVLDALLGLLDLGAEGEVRMTAATTGESTFVRSIRMAILARSIPATERNAPRLIRLQTRLAEIERDAAGNVALAAPVRATVEPIPAEQLRSQSVLVTPPISICVVRAGIGPDLDRCIPWGSPVIHGPLAEADAFYCRPASRRTA